MARAQQPISTQLDCRIHTRWAFGQKRRSTRSSSAVSCPLQEIVHDTLVERGEGNFDKLGFSVDQLTHGFSVLLVLNSSLRYCRAAVKGGS